MKRNSSQKAISTPRAKVNKLTLHGCVSDRTAQVMGHPAYADTADRVKKFPRNSRTRFVQPHEMPRVLEALQSEPGRRQLYFLMLLLTGARRNEALTCQWRDLDLEQHAQRIAAMPAAHQDHG